MKKAKLIEGEIVEIPFYHFAPMRRGWNGWMFTTAQVIKVLGKNKYGQRVVLLDVCDHYGKNGEHYEQRVSEDRIFENHGIVKRMQDDVNEHPASDFINGKYNTVVYWLADKGLVTGLR